MAQEPNSVHELMAAICSSMTQEPKSVYELVLAAQKGDVDTLYRLIGEDTNVLQWIDKMEFVDTPLHAASAAGHLDFAMEMMYLKPSFATKLNKDGLSPLHIALQKGHTNLALSLLKIDNRLVAIKGKMGCTPLHYLAEYEKDRKLMELFLNDYPDCIFDLTSQDETALHVAAKKENWTALKVLLLWLRRTAKCSMVQKNKILNAKNRDDETVLHVAVSTGQPEPKIVRLLTNLRIKSKMINSKGKTALDILHSRGEEDDSYNINIKECTAILHNTCWKPTDVVRRIPGFLLELLTQWIYEINHMSIDRGNALLVVTVLILTATYQATLSPPGGVYGENALNPASKFSSFNIYNIGSMNSSASTSDLHHHHLHHVMEKGELFKANNGTAGSSVLDTASFLWFFVPNMVAFSTSFLLTCLILLTLVSGLFSSVLMLSLSTLLFCLLDSALIIISPNNESSKILFTCVYTMVYITYSAIFFVIVPKLRKFISSL